MAGGRGVLTEEGGIMGGGAERRAVVAANIGMMSERWGARRREENTL